MEPRTIESNSSVGSRLPSRRDGALQIRPFEVTWLHIYIVKVASESEIDEEIVALLNSC